MMIISYVFVFLLGIAGGMCVAGLLTNSKHNIDETQRKRRTYTTPSMHDEEV